MYIGMRLQCCLYLDQQITALKAQAYAPNTTQSYNCHRKTYLRFCQAMGYPAVPATRGTICRYAAFLSRTLKFNSIKQYLNIIRIFHLEWDLPNPLQDFNLQLVLRGTRRTLGDTVCQKSPITPLHLHKIFHSLDMSNPLDINVWAIALILFFGLLRKGSVLPKSSKHSEWPNILLREDVSFHSWGMMLKIRTTKTIQFKQRQLQIPMPKQSGYMCPCQAIFRAMKLVSHSPMQSPVFLIPYPRKPIPVTGPMFVKCIRACFSDKETQTHISGHSFRRGGATLAYALGIPAETIRALGDWRSSAYLTYLDIDHPKLFCAIAKMQLNSTN